MLKTDWHTEVHVLMFDCYGTLLDIRSGLIDAVTPYLLDKGWIGSPDALVTWWRRAHFENSMIDALLHRDHSSYRKISSDALAYTLERANVAYTHGDIDELVSRIETVEPFPDVVEALQLLRKKYRLSILSNADADVLAHARNALDVDFDRVISTAEAGTFKPHVACYRTAAELLGMPPDSILYVSNHTFDCVGAKAYGMYSCYVDRRMRPFGRWS